MSNEYHNKILKMANVQFENIKDEDILTWDYFDQGFGMRSWYYLYRPDGSLKDLQCGQCIPVSERKFSRPAYKKSPEMLEAEAQRANKVERKLKKDSVPVIITGTQNVKKKGTKRNLTPSERNRRAERMREVAKNYWAQKRKNNAKG